MDRTRTVPIVNWANAFTMLRVALVPVFAWLLLWSDPALPLAAAAVFCLAAATDFVDGWVARRLDVVTSFGEFLDPTADKLLVGTALVVLALDGRVAWWPLWIIFAREAAVQVLRTWLARGGRSLPAAPLGKAKTVTQDVAVVALTLLPAGHLGGAVLIVAAVLLTVVSAFPYFADALRGRAGIPWR